MDLKSIKLLKSGEQFYLETNKCKKIRNIILRNVFFSSLQIFLSAVCVCAFAQSVQVFRPQAARSGGNEQAAQILRQSYDASPDGSSYQWK